jgi:hypothetical protein
MPLCFQGGTPELALVLCIKWFQRHEKHEMVQKAKGVTVSNGSNRFQERARGQGSGSRSRQTRALCRTPATVARCHAQPAAGSISVAARRGSALMAVVRPCVCLGNSIPLPHCLQRAHVHSFMLGPRLLLGPRLCWLCCLSGLPLTVPPVWCDAPQITIDRGTGDSSKCVSSCSVPGWCPLC